MEHLKGDADQLTTETQLSALQEQLVAVMLENQNLAEEAKTLRESSATEQLRQQLEREREKSRILMERLQDKETKERERSEREARERERHTREKSLPPGDKSPRSSSRGRFAWKRRGLEKSKSLDQSEFLASLNSASGGGSGATCGSGSETPTSTTATTTTVAAAAAAAAPSVSSPGQDSDSDDVAIGDIGVCDQDQGLPEGPIQPAVVSPKDPWWRRMEVRLVSEIGELLRDFSEVAEEEQPDGDPEGDPLTVKKLKENILRFGCVMRPLTELSAVVTSLLRWESPSATLLALLIYLYSVLFGWLLTLVLVLAILKLSFNYLKKRGWTQIFLRRLRRREGGESVDMAAGEAGLGDKFALVLQVARRVQNQLGAVSNAAEKVKNLCLWEHEATQRLYLFLCLLLAASVLLPAAQLFTITGIYLGLKFFVLDFIFFRYPRIRLKYDTTSRLWDTLPTDADLERRAEKNRNDNGNSSPDLSSFLELFNLPPTETPLPGWQSGRRCTLVNRDRSLTSAFKNGRLYLTNSFLCFERSKSHSVKNLKLPLKEARVEKANSYPWIPGGGMAIEVSVDGKSFFFAAILNRDDVFDDVLEGCRRAGSSRCDVPHPSERPKDPKEAKEIKDQKDAKEAKDK